MPLLADVLPPSIDPLPGPDRCGGFVVGSSGHLYKSKLVVAIGFLMIFSATLLLPLAVIATEEELGSTSPDPGARLRR